MHFMNLGTVATCSSKLHQKGYRYFRKQRLPIESRLQAERFLENYCEWLSSGFTSFVMLIFLGLYWWTSIKGALSAKAVLTPDKLFLSNSPMLEMNALRSKYVMPAYTFITVYVTKPGNLSEAMSVARIKNMVGEFEALPECNGPMFTKFWIRDYESYRSSELVADDPSFAAAAYSSEDIRTFLKFSEYSHWGGFMKFDNDTDTISAFFMTVAYHGANQSDWNQRLIMLKKWRAIVDRFKDIGASIYEDEALFTDQIETLVPTTVQTSLMTLACMTLVCCAFMSNIFTVLIAASSITSICVGVFGFLSLWGIDVDPISMATLIMSIGLSVDFPAHITFHYYRTGLTSNLTTVQERMAHSLSAIGFPLLQSSLSTVLFVLSLLFTPCYMTEVFIKAVFLVISLGIVHALVAIPALLCALSHIYKYLSDIRDNSSVMSGSAASGETKVSKLSQSPVVRRIRSETGNKIVPVAGNLRR